MDDPKITNMDPVRKIWMFNNWIEDQNENIELTKNHAYLIASFDHPEEVQKLLGNGQVHLSTDEEFDDTSDIVKSLDKVNGIEDLLSKVSEMHNNKNDAKTRRKIQR